MVGERCTCRSCYQLAQCVRKKVDAFLSSISSKWKLRVEMKRKAYKEKIEVYLKNPPLITIAGAQLSHTIYQATIWFLIAFLFYVYSTTPATGTGYLTPPAFITNAMMKRSARAASILLIFVWTWYSTSASTQRQFLKDVESRLLGR